MIRVSEVESFVVRVYVSRLRYILHVFLGYLEGQEALQALICKINGAFHV